jgi:hypothetical protein
MRRTAILPRRRRRSEVRISRFRFAAFAVTTIGRETNVLRCSFRDISAELFGPNLETSLNKIAPKIDTAA